MKILITSVSFIILCFFGLIICRMTETGYKSTLSERHIDPEILPLNEIK